MASKVPAQRIEFEVTPESPKFKQKKMPRSNLTHPPYYDMVISSIRALKQRCGSSKKSITEHIKSNFSVGPACNLHVNFALKRLVQYQKLFQMKGSGKFKINRVTESLKAVKPVADNSNAKPRDGRKTGPPEETTAEPKTGVKKRIKNAKKGTSKKGT